MLLTIKPISAFDHNYIWLISDLALELATNPFLRCDQPFHHCARLERPLLVEKSRFQ
jgi:hypothetical protein